MLKKSKDNQKDEFAKKETKAGLRNDAQYGNFSTSYASLTLASFEKTSTNEIVQNGGQATRRALTWTKAGTTRRPSLLRASSR